MDSIQILTQQNFPDYELLDSGNGRKLERFGEYILDRIETQALWTPNLAESEWNRANAVFERRNAQSGESERRGHWNKKNSDMPDSWQIQYKNLVFELKLTPFGHVGIFPEQSAQWDWINEKIEQYNNGTIKQSNNVSILNLFSYTGASSLAAAAAGAHVTHVDASKPAISWAIENQKLSGLEQKPIRWIVDDALKFVKREVRRGNKYNGIIMDPPKYGRGAHEEVWKFEENFPELLDYCRQILKPDWFIFITAYAVPISSITLANTTVSILKKTNLEFGELGLSETNSKRILPTAIFVRG